MRKDYNTKQYHNDVFTKRAKRVKQKRFHFSLTFFLILAIFCGIFWFFLYSPVFALKNMEITGNNPKLEDGIRDMAWGRAEGRSFLIFLKKNFFIFNSSGLEKDIKNSYTLNSLKITKIPPNKILIRYEEKPSKFSWLEAGNYYYISDGGDIISEISSLDIDLKNTPLIENTGINIIQDKKVSGGEDLVNFAAKLNDYLSANNKIGEINLAVEKFIVSGEQNTLSVKILNGPVILFNVKEKLETQFTKLSVLVSGKLKNDFWKKSYIDLRYGEAVYYK